MAYWLGQNSIVLGLLRSKLLTRFLLVRGSTRFQAAGGKGEFQGRLDTEAIYGRTLATKALGSDKALRLLRPQARLQQVRVADLPGTPAEGHSSLLVLDHSKLNH